MRRFALVAPICPRISVGRDQHGKGSAPGPFRSIAAAATKMSNPAQPKAAITAAMAVVMIGGIASLTATDSAHARSEARCKYEFLQSCKKQGGSHEGCVAAAHSVCATEQAAGGSSGADKDKGFNANTEPQSAPGPRYKLQQGWPAK